MGLQRPENRAHSTSGSLHEGVPKQGQYDCKDIPGRWCGTTVVWRDVTVAIKSNKKSSDKVISTSTGYAVPKTVTAIMGPSRSGKSTLLRTLSGYLPRNAKFYGELCFDGRRGWNATRSCAFITPNDELIKTLTVKETLEYASLLHCPDHITSLQRSALVDEVMALMELTDFVDFRVGGTFGTKGLPDGQKRSLSIAVQLLKKPSLVLIDEPISSLDSVSATLMIIKLRRLAQTGCTVVLAIHQCNAETFKFLDKIFLLANGKTMFFGEPLACLEHFSNAGFPCPLYSNPSDYFINALTHDYEEVVKVLRQEQDCEEANVETPRVTTALVVQTLENSFKFSSQSAAVESMVNQLLDQDSQKVPSQGTVNCFRKFAALTWRTFINMLRDWHYFWFRILLSALFLICFGTIYIGFKNSFSIQEQVSALFYMIWFTCVFGISGYQSVVKDLKVNAIQDTDKHGSNQIGVSFFLLANMLSSFPFLFSVAVLLSAVSYIFLMQKIILISFIYFTVNVFLCLTVSEGLMMTVAVTLQNTGDGIVTVVFIQGMLLLLSGYFRRFGNIPELVWKYPCSYLSFYAYSFEGLLQNEWLDMNEASSNKNPYSLDLLKYTDASLVHGKWKNVFILMVMASAFRVIVLLRIKYSKSSFQQLRKL